MNSAGAITFRPCQFQNIRGRYDEISCCQDEFHIQISVSPCLNAINSCLNILFGDFKAELNTVNYMF